MGLPKIYFMNSHKIKFKQIILKIMKILISLLYDLIIVEVGKNMVKRLYIIFIFIFLGSFINPCKASSANRPKVGLALSGGGALGLAHIGILKKIDSLEIPLDYIAGTSMGGLVGGLYACGYSAKQIEKIVNNINWENIFRDVPDREHLPYFVRQDLHKYQFNINMNRF